MELQANGFPKRVGPTALALSATSHYTATFRVVIERWMFTNTASSDGTVSVSIVPSGGSASTANRIFSSMTVPANDVMVTIFPIVLNVGDSVQVTGSATTMNLTFHVNNNQFGVQ